MSFINYVAYGAQHMPELSNDLLYSENCFATYQISNAKIINTGFHGRN